jgi:hypothetical protein
LYFLREACSHLVFGFAQVQEATNEFVAGVFSLTRKKNARKLVVKKNHAPSAVRARCTHRNERSKLGLRPGSGFQRTKNNCQSCREKVVLTYWIGSLFVGKGFLGSPKKAITYIRDALRTCNAPPGVRSSPRRDARGRQAGGLGQRSSSSLLKPRARDGSGAAIYLSGYN